MNHVPLILTLRFDAASFRRFDAERRRFFPPERNLIPAHLTLFHKLPGSEEAAILGRLREAAAKTASMPLHVKGLRFLGYGTAYEVESAALLALRAELAEGFAPWLSPQDAQGFRPHVTIQNKAPANEAKSLFQTLREGFAPFEAEGTGLCLWRYRGGPWERAAAIAFDGGT